MQGAIHEYGERVIHDALQFGDKQAQGYTRLNIGT